MAGFSILVNVFEDFGGIPSICTPFKNSEHSLRNKVIGAVLVAHELGHALYEIPDVYDHGDACLMNSSVHSLNNRQAYELMTEAMSHCPKCSSLAEQRMNNRQD